MKLLPSLRTKKRYLVFEVQSSKIFSFPEIKEEAEKSLHRFLGELWMGKAAPMILDETFNQKTQRFIVKVSNQYVEELKAAFTLSKTIKSTPIILKSIITSGTLKKAKSYLGNE
jgi:RNase P/RNase MRP subunit POP5